MVDPPSHKNQRSGEGLGRRPTFKVSGCDACTILLTKPTPSVRRQPSSSYTYTWELYLNDELVSQWSGTEITLTLVTTGRYTMQVQAFSRQKNVRGTAKDTLYVKYVRREIRSLLPEDREAFMEAAHTIWTVSKDAGEELYGSDYEDIHVSPMLC